MRVIVTGSTVWQDREAVRRELCKLPAGTIIIHGDCPGVDALAGEVGRELGFLVECWQKNKADRQKYGRLAWQGLNERMLQAGAVLVLGFHAELAIQGKAKGTKHMLQLAEAVGIEVRTFTG